MRLNELNDPSWRVRALALIQSPGQTVFTPLTPGETGLSHTIWYSESPHWPVIAVAEKPGRTLSAKDAGYVFEIGEQTPFADINDWAAENGKILHAVANNEISAFEFLDRMTPLMPPKRRQRSRQ